MVQHADIMMRSFELEDLKFHIQSYNANEVLLNCNFYGDMQFLVHFDTNEVEIMYYDTERSTAIYYQLLLKDNIGFVADQLFQRV